MMQSYCVDVSGSMSRRQIINALNRVSIDWKHGDLVYIFDHASADQISFDQLVNYSLEIDDPDDLRQLLFKKGSYHRWQGSGAAKAAMLAPNHSIKVCVTDGFLVSDDFKAYNKIVKMP